MRKQPLDHESVVETAARLADRDGLDSITLTGIAEELGVRQPALYRHVDGYQDLVRSLGLRGREILGASLTDAAMGVSGREAVAAVGHAWRRVAQEHPGLYAATDRHPCTDDPELEQAVDRIVSIISAALAGFDLSDDDRIHAARALRSAFHGFAHLDGGDGHPHPNDVDETFNRMIEMMCTGIEAGASQSPAKN